MRKEQVPQNRDWVDCGWHFLARSDGRGDPEGTSYLQVLHPSRCTTGSVYLAYSMQDISQPHPAPPEELTRVNRDVSMHSVWTWRLVTHGDPPERLEITQKSRFSWGAVGLGLVMGAVFLSIALAVRHFSESLPADFVHVFFNFGIIAAPLFLIAFPLLAAGFIQFDRVRWNGKRRLVFNARTGTLQFPYEEASYEREECARLIVAHTNGTLCSRWDGDGNLCNQIYFLIQRTDGEWKRHPIGEVRNKRRAEEVLGRLQAVMDCEVYRRRMGYLESRKLGMPNRKKW